MSIGNSNSYVAAGQGGGIEILLNEYSNRSTPSMVAFNEDCRSMGVDASSNLFMNFKNTIYDLMVLLGKPYKDLKLQDSNGRPLYSFNLEEAEDGQAQVVVRYLGQERKFTIVQVLAMLFTKLRGIAHDATNCVLSCPQFFDDNQKSALMQAALVSGLKPLQIITDMSAVILNYAYYRTTKGDGDKLIAFVNFGQSNLQSVVAWLTPKEDVVRILAEESELIGGQDLDRCLAEHFIKTHNLKLTPKSYLKLVSACEKLKRLLSANANEIPINVESLISEDQDFTARIDRTAFEQLSQPVLERVEACLRRTLENAKSNFVRMLAEAAERTRAAEKAKAAKKAEAAKKVEEAKAAKKAEETKPAESTDAPMATEGAEEANDAANNAENAGEAKAAESVNETKATESPEEPTPAETPEKPVSPPEVKFEVQGVEMVGGSVRIPIIKQLTQNVFNITPSTTLNTDEAVARGCVLQCATLHPGMKVRREVKILNVDYNDKLTSLTCDKGLRRVELELVQQDRKYKARTEARNSLEEYIYSERSKLQEGDQFLEQLSQALEWLSSDEGEEASEEVYNIKLAELKSISDARLMAAKKSQEEAGDQKQQQQQQQDQQQPEQQSENNVQATKTESDVDMTNETDVKS